MFYDVFYDLDCNEGWYYETFDNINDALKFAINYPECRIVRYQFILPLDTNIKFLF